jgi:hypothetical protein
MHQSGYQMLHLLLCFKSELIEAVQEEGTPPFIEYLNERILTLALLPDVFLHGVGQTTKDPIEVRGGADELLSELLELNKNWDPTRRLARKYGGVATKNGGLALPGFAKDDQLLALPKNLEGGPSFRVTLSPFGDPSGLAARWFTLDLFRTRGAAQLRLDKDLGERDSFGTNVDSRDLNDGRVSRYDSAIRRERIIVGRGHDRAYQ